MSKCTYYVVIEFDNGSFTACVSANNETEALEEAREMFEESESDKVDWTGYFIRSEINLMPFTIEIAK